MNRATLPQGNSLVARDQSHSTTCRVSISAVRSILRQRVHRPPLRGVLLHAGLLHEVLQHGEPLFQLFSLAQREFSECLDDIVAKRARREVLLSRDALDALDLAPHPRRHLGGGELLLAGRPHLSVLIVLLIPRRSSVTRVTGVYASISS